MTARFRNPSKCKHCSEVLFCPKCGKEHTATTKFSDWIRSVLNDSGTYDVQNLDFIRFHYRDGWLITVEEKQYGYQSSEAQRDTHNIVAQLLFVASGSKVKTWRGVRPIYYKGHYVIAFEKTNPEDSQWVRINGKLYDNPSKVVFELFKDPDLFASRSVLQEQVRIEVQRDQEWLS